MSHTYFLFRPQEESQVIYHLPSAAVCPAMTYAFDATQGSWYIRDTKQARWLNMDPEGVPEPYRLELLLLRAAYP